MVPGVQQSVASAVSCSMLEPGQHCQLVVRHDSSVKQQHTQQCGTSPVQMMGTRGISSFLYTPGSCTLVGLSAMFISVAFTIWLFTVYCVDSPKRPAPASKSLMKSAHILPFLIRSDASLARRMRRTRKRRRLNQP